MGKSYIRRFEKISQHLSGEKIKIPARLPGNAERTFTRNRKMPLQDIILCCLAKKGLTTVFELRHYFQQRDNGMKLSKQGYLQQRKRLNPDIFSTLNDEYLIDFYESGEAELWNGYLLLTMDGSKAEVPNSQENRECFGTMTNQHTDTGPVRAVVSGMYDILNGFYPDIEIAHISGNEGEPAKQNLRHLQSMGIKQPVLVIFDRGYPSLELIDFPEEEGFCYIFRFASNDYRAERGKLRSSDEIVTLTQTEARLRKIHRFDYM